MAIAERVQNELEIYSDEIDKHRAQMKKSFGKQIDDLLDDEIKRYKTEPKKGFSLGGSIRGVYYLTLAKFTNPIAYKMAWSVIAKLSEAESEERD